MPNSALSDLLDSLLCGSGDQFDKSIHDKRVRKLQSLMKSTEPVHFNTIAARKGGGGAYAPGHGIHLSAKDAKHLSKHEMVTLSHELGHAKNFKILNKLKLSNPYMISRMAAVPSMMIGMAGQSETKTREGDRNVAIAASALPSIQLGEELTASARGLRHIPKIYGGGIKGVARSIPGLTSTAMTVGSYGALAALPWAMHAASGKPNKKDLKK